MLNQYVNLIAPGLKPLAESRQKYQYLTERHIQALWLEQKYFKELKSASGESIEVLSPGIWNMGAGPDFQRAHLKIGSKEYLGDIEIHLIDDGWFQHQHHTDPLYNNVVLHLSLWQPTHAKTLITSDGRKITQAYFEPSLTLPPARIVQLIDLDLYPYKRFVGSGKCAHTLFRNLSENKALNFFKAASEWRLNQKFAYLNMRIEKTDWQFPAGIAMALGYKNNAAAFLELFLQLSTLAPKSEDHFLSIAMKACGFFNEDFQKKWNDSPVYRKLYDTQAALPSIPEISLKLHQIRPLNHPLRRLVYMAKLLSDPQLERLYRLMIGHWNDIWLSCQNKSGYRALFAQLLAHIPSYHDSHWNWHYHFEQLNSNKFLPLIGESLKEEILVNSFFPLLYEQIHRRGDSQEIDTFWGLYGCIPASKSGKSRYLVHRFFGDTIKGKLLDKSYIEQGAFQLHRDFCVHFESSCEGCPFVERYKTLL